MPNILIEVRKKYSKEEEVALIEAVHNALVHAFKNPPQDKNVRLVVHEPHRFACSSSRANPDAFTHITIDCFKGRTLETKRTLYKTIVQNLEKYGIPKDHVEIIVREMDQENFGIRGGQAAIDVDLGFEVKV